MANEATITDTQRLDWLLGKGNPELDHEWQTGKHWIKWYAGDHFYIVRGNSPRECIDQALLGRAERLE